MPLTRAKANALLEGVTGQYYDVASSPYVRNDALSTVALVANTLYAIPFYVPYAAAIDRVGINVTSAAAAGKLIRCGIYAMDTKANAYKPAALVIDGGANLAADSTGVKEHTIAQTLVGGTWYYLAVESDGTPTVHAYNGQVGNPFGLTALGAGTCSIWTRSFTYAALPDPFGGTPVLASTSLPRVGVRAV